MYTQCPLGDMLRAADYASGGRDAAGGRVAAGGRTDAAPAGRAPRTGALAMVSTSADECDCVSGAAPAGDGVCSTAEMVARVAGFAAADARTGRPADVIRAAAQKLGCDTEGCVVSHPQLVSHIRASLGPADADRHQVEVRLQFKTPGPRYGNALLSNHVIDEVLRRWAVEFPSFFNCPFAMFDFDRVAGYQLSTLDLAAVAEGRESQLLFDAAPNSALRTARPCDTFACVLNTDVSSGRGKHWVCMFADMREMRQGRATVEYFNSSGRPPTASVTRWMEKQAALLRDADADEHDVRAVVVSSVAHQRSKTECGLYALFYIRARLEGRPWNSFSRERVPDRDMEEFRQHVFSGKN